MAHRRRGVGVGRTSHAHSSNVPTPSSVSSSSSTTQPSQQATSNPNNTNNNNNISLVQKKVNEMKSISVQHAIQTLELLEMKLTEFAVTYSNELEHDPIFRHRFLQVCAPLGIDVLSLSSHHSKSSSSNNNTTVFQKIFGSSGITSNNNKKSDEYYYELAVQCAEVCIATQSRNGGIMDIYEIQSILQNRTTKYGTTSLMGVQHPTTISSSNKKNSSNNTKNQPQKYDIPISDIELAIEQLSLLGGGFRTIQVGGCSSSTTTTTGHNNTSKSTSSTTMVISVPTELNHDHMEILNIAQEHILLSNDNNNSSQNGGITIDDIYKTTQWTYDRIQHAIDLLLHEGMIWIDIYHHETYYWITTYMWHKK